MKRVISNFIDAKGVRLHVRTVPCRNDEAAPVVILHGFTGSTESMRGVVAELCGTRTTVCIDLIGHGSSDAPRELACYSMERCADQIAAVMDALALSRPHLLGYSMGGRVALSFCIRFPERVRSALVVGASAGLSDPAKRNARIADDEALADHILALGMERFIDEWMAKPLFASQARLGEGFLANSRAQRLRNRPRGLAASLRGMGTGAMPPLALSGLKIPTCFVAGAEDEKFCAIARAFGNRLAQSRFAIVPRAGHAAHLENQEELGRVARQFFAEMDAQEN